MSNDNHQNENRAGTFHGTTSKHSHDLHIRPSLSTAVFSADRVYRVYDVNERGTLGAVRDDKGYERFITLPVGGRCPHLKPNLPKVIVGDRFNQDQREWDAAGHWSPASPE